MNQSQAEISRQQAVQNFRRQYIERPVPGPGDTVAYVPREDKVVEWALLEIVDLLRVISHQLIRLAAF